MRTAIALCALLLVGSSTFAQTTVYVFTAHDPSGLTDKPTKERLEAVAGIQKRLEKNAAVRLVPSKDEATVTLEILGVWQAEQTGTTSSTIPAFGTLQTQTSATAKHYDVATIASGSYRSELKVSSAKAFGKVSPGEQLTKAFEKWLKENHQALTR